AARLDKGRKGSHWGRLYGIRTTGGRSADRHPGDPRGAMASYTTAFASLDHYDKGGVEIINDDPKNYVFSNMFDVASAAQPWEKVAVAKNMEYVLEVIRADGTSEWRGAPPHQVAPIADRAGGGGPPHPPPPPPPAPPPRP